MAKQKKNNTKPSRMKLVIRLLLAVLILLSAVVGYMGYVVWCDHQVVFQDVTVELGAESLSIRDFMTEKAKPQRVSFVSDPSKIDLSKLGKTQIRLQHGIKEYTVTLTVEDTVAPAAAVQTEYQMALSDPFPEAKVLSGEIQDASAVTVAYETEPQIPEDYSDLTVTVILTDAAGNETRGDCTIHFYGWVRQSCTLELGQELTAEMVLVNPEKDGAYLEQAQLDAVDTVGEHTVTVTSGNSQESCLVTVVDTTAPTLTVQNLRRQPGSEVTAEDFVKSASDLSGDPEIRLVGELPDPGEAGQHTVTLEAVDASGNTTQKEATLWIATNLNPPQIHGATSSITMEKREEVDFLEGVRAIDDIDKNLEVTVDTSALDTSAAGTYYITYSATDSSGNEGTYKRKVVVEPDEEDTAAMVKEIAATLPDDPEAIRDFVHDRIVYSSNWGGDDPVYYGLTKDSGNCYVHALTLKALLEEKGYETQLIWVTNESHYWLIIKLEEGWRHIDSTPSAQHEAIGLATDKVRYKNLNGRNWDRSKWPACE